MTQVQSDLDKTLSPRFATPAGTQVHQGASQSLDASGIAELGF